MTEPEPLLLTDEAITRTASSWLSRKTPPGRRLIFGIAGIAGSGKSTLAQRLVDTLNRAEAETAAFIPMDGFHLTNAELDVHGWKPRKGAHFTYDARAYVDLLRHYRNRSAIGGYPVYCRKAHEPILHERGVTDATRIIVTEGQYLLRPETPWGELADVLDECWWLDVPPEIARGWLMRRDTSVGRSPEAAEAKYQCNDRLNTEYVLADHRPADRVACWPEQI